MKHKQKFNSGFGCFLLRETPIKDDKGRIIAFSEEYHRVPLFEKDVFVDFFFRCKYLGRDLSTEKS